MEIKEYLLTSSRHSQHHSACLYDYRTGNVLHTYKTTGNPTTIAPKTLQLISDAYLIAADATKPLIHTWQLNNQEATKKLTTILAERPTCLRVCPRSAYIAAGIGTKLYIWQISSGKLFAVQKRHFQPISCIAFSTCGGFVLVGGDDGLLVAYDFASLVGLHAGHLESAELGQVEPLYTRNDHSQAISGLHVGVFGAQARFATAARDQTAKVYSLLRGQLLLSLIFDVSPTSVVFDANCWELYVGLESGPIQQFHLKEPPRALDHHPSTEIIAFKGHQKAVTALGVNCMNTCLVSGSFDGFVFVWELKSRQIVRRIDLQGEVTNVAFVRGFENFLVHSFRPKVFVKSLERERIQGGEFVVTLLQENDAESSGDEEGNGRFGVMNGRHDLEEENVRLRAINKEIFDAAIHISKKYNQF